MASLLDDSLSDDELPAGARVVRRGQGQGEKPRDLGMTHAEFVLRTVHPGAEITDILRDPNSPLGRKNRNSWHVRAGREEGVIPMDVRPIPGMDFPEFVDGFKRKGFDVVQAIDEVKHPSRNATGPHWHIVLDGGDLLPANAKILRLGGGASAAPAAAPAVPAPTGRDIADAAALVGKEPPAPSEGWQTRYAVPAWRQKLTRLPPEQEDAFQRWAQTNNVPLTDDYDMRAFWKSGGDATINRNDGQPHYPDTFKTPLHRSFSGESMFADPATNPPRWNESDQLVGPDGTVFLDERAAPRRPRPEVGAGAALPQQRMPSDLFRSRAGAIASDRSKPVEERFGALRKLADDGGFDIPDEDLKQVAENGLAMVELQGGGGSDRYRLNTLRAAPPAEASGRPRDPKPGEAVDARLKGVNDEVRRIINGRSPDVRQIAGHLKARKMPETEIAAIIPLVERAIRWRRENGGRPYTGAISLDVRTDGTVATSPEEQARRTQQKIDAAFGHQELTSGPTPDEMSTRQLFGDAFRNLGHPYADRIERQADVVPLVGGAIGLEEGLDRVRAGDPSGVVVAALGAADFLPGGKAARTVFDSAELGRIARGADGATDVAAATAHIRAAADDALAQGGRVTMHTESGAVPIVRPGLVDESGNAWDASHILAAPQGGRRLEIELPQGASERGGRVASGGEASPPAASAGSSGGPPPPSRMAGGGEPLPEGARVIRRGGAEPSAPPPARMVRPEEVEPIPGNRVESAEEAAAIPSRIQRVVAPDEAAELAPRRIATGPGDKTKVARGPIDLTQRLRQLGGLKDDGGELVSMGIGNTPRKLPFGSDRGLASLVNNKSGLSLDEATRVLHDEGWFPNIPANDRPTPDVLLDALKRDSLGHRTFHPDNADEVARFEAAADERARVEAAADEGSPLADDVGQPIAREDLDATEPPLSAYEDSPRLVGKVGNLNLERVEKPEDVTRLVQRVRDMVQVDNKALQRVGNEELRLLARDLNVTPDKILNWKQGQLPDAATLYATRVVVHQGRTKLAAMAKRARGASDEELARFHNMIVAQSQLERQLAGMTAETGRALQQFNMIAKAGDQSDQAIKAYLRSAGGREHVEDMAEKLIDLVEDPAQAGRFIRDAAKVRKRDMLNELWVNSLLSGPRTHVVNAVSNTMTALWTLPEQALTAGIGAALRTPDRALLMEVGKRATGMMQGAREGLTLAKQAIRSGDTLDAVTKVEATSYKAIPNFGRERTIPKLVPIIGGVKTTTFPVGSLVRIPTKGLTAADEFFKSVNRRAAIDALAYRRATLKGGTAEERAALFDELRTNPDEVLRKAGDDEARYLTFQKPLGAGGRHLQGIANEWVGAKLILPFVRTPINILKFAGERNILTAPMMKEFRDAIRAGGNARNEAIARVTLGSGLSALAVTYAMDGRISGGGPSDPEEAAALKNGGWQPYSIKIGDKWISYQRFEPLSLLVGIAADFAEVGAYADNEEADTIAMSLLQSIAKNVTSKTWLSGASDFFDALSDPERFGPAFVNRLTSSMAVPAFVAHMAGSTDDTLRDSRSILDKIRERVPGLSDNIEARRNVWGDEIKRGDSIGPDYVSPVYASQDSPSPFLREVAGLRAPLSMPQRSIKVAGKSVRLTPEQYSYYVQLSGKPARKFFEQFAQTPRWQRMSPDVKRKFLHDKMEDFRDTARGQLREMFPELAATRLGSRVKARVKDGDTISADIRLFGVDAFELKQTCAGLHGKCEACGEGARRYVTQVIANAGDDIRYSFTGDTTYGRPVATAMVNGKDLGEMMIRDGWAVAEPKYLKNDQPRLRRYQAAEAEARQAKRGAHAFGFTTPEQYRHGRRLHCD